MERIEWATSWFRTNAAIEGRLPVTTTRLNCAPSSSCFQTEPTTWTTTLHNKTVSWGNKRRNLVDSPTVILSSILYKMKAISVAASTITKHNKRYRFDSICDRFPRTPTRRIKFESLGQLERVGKLDVWFHVDLKFGSLQVSEHSWKVKKTVWEETTKTNLLQCHEKKAIVQ